MSGSEGTERVTCVYCLPVNMQLSMLLIDGLAKNILLEMSSRWNKQLHKDIKEMGELDNVKNIGVLLVAAKDEGEGTDYINEKEVSDILEQFAVGTEQ
eukprot:1865670-Ditylum_brightwellii.AAC.1